MKKLILYLFPSYKKVAKLATFKMTDGIITTWKEDRIFNIEQSDDSIKKQTQGLTALKGHGDCINIELISQSKINHFISSNRTKGIPKLNFINILKNYDNGELRDWYSSKSYD